MRVSLSKYISKKLDGVEGEIPRMIHMFKKSFSAPNFKYFWTYWNPIYSYVLGFYVYKPIKKVFSATIARTITFLINGIFHDIVVSLIMGKVSYLVTLLFLIYAIQLIVEDHFKIRLKKSYSKVSYNLFMLITPFVIIMIYK